MSRFPDPKGFGLVVVLVVILVVVAVGGVGFYVWERQQKAPAKDSTSSNTTPNPTPTVDPYGGWREATSSRAKFSIKYPASWSYSIAVSDKDNIEHMVLSGAHLTIKIDSFIGKDPTGGGNPNTMCADCQQTVTSASFDVAKLGKVQLDTVRYTLDSGLGNALILRLSD